MLAKFHYLKSNWTVFEVGDLTSFNAFSPVILCISGVILFDSKLRRANWLLVAGSCRYSYTS